MLDHFMSFDPSAELSGMFILSFIHSMWADDVIPLIKKHGFEEVEADAWYSQQAWLDFLTELYRLPDSLNRMVSVGLKVGDALPFPPEVNTLEQAMEFSSQAMDHLHSGLWGSEKVEKVSKKHVRVIAHTPYPDAATYGVYWAVAKRFPPASKDFTITSSHPGIMRFTSPDDAPLVIDISWQE